MTSHAVSDQRMGPDMFYELYRVNTEILGPNVHVGLARHSSEPRSHWFTYTLCVGSMAKTFPSPIFQHT